MSKPLVNISMQVDLEVEYDPFTGRTPDQFAKVIEDDLHTALNDFREDDVQGIFSTITSVNLVETAAQCQ